MPEGRARLGCYHLLGSPGQTATNRLVCPPIAAQSGLDQPITARLPTQHTTVHTTPARTTPRPTNVGGSVVTNAGPGWYHKTRAATGRARLDTTSRGDLGAGSLSVYTDSLHSPRLCSNKMHGNEKAKSIGFLHDQLIYRVSIASVGRLVERLLWAFLSLF